MLDQAPGTFAYLLDQRRSAYWMRGPLSSGWWGLLLAVPADEAVDSWVVVARMHLLADEASPDDILPLVVGLGRKLDKYASESNAAWRARGLNAFGIYALGGTEEAIETQLLAAGYGPTTTIGTWGTAGHTWGQSGYRWGDRGAFVLFKPFARGPRNEPPPYRTQFWVQFANGFHPVTGTPIPWGQFPWDGTQEPWGAPKGFTLDFYRETSAIIRKWKPPEYVFRGFRFQIGSLVTWGEAGHHWGESSQLWGSTVDLSLWA